MKVLITGCNGFIGHSIARSFQRSGHKVYGVGRASNPFLPTLDAYFSTDLSVSGLNGILNSCPVDLVIHAAGAASVPGSYISPVDDFRGNALSWIAVLESIKTFCPEARAVLLSSAAVYGNGADEQLSETSPVSPVSPYGYHKAMAEQVAAEFASCYGLNVLCLRLFSVFGERQRRLLLWDTFQKLRGNPESLHVDGSGEEARDYLWVEDLSAILSAVLPGFEEKGHSTLNVASGDPICVRDLVEFVKASLGVATKFQFSGQERRGDPKRLVADITRLQNVTRTPVRKPTFDSMRRCLTYWMNS